ncbi:MAG: hypothetical protein IT480_14295 [Gammaproteobacteria bacterium]|nr:hypothetical protein [Gammaproteobacteria bacterium]
MGYTQSLTEYLVGRRRRNVPTKFTTGEWLETLSDAELKGLSDSLDLPDPEVVGLAVSERARVDDLMAVCRLALEQERKRAQRSVSWKTVSNLAVLASYVLLKRAGRIEIRGKMALAPDFNPPTIEITGIGGSRC